MNVLSIGHVAVIVLSAATTSSTRGRLRVDRLIGAGVAAVVGIAGPPDSPARSTAAGILQRVP